MNQTDHYLHGIKKRFPEYRFSWEVYTDLILENVANKPYWLDIGAGSNIIIKEQPGADLAVGLDLEKPTKISLSQNEAYCVASTDRLPFKDKSFGFVTSRYTFEHLKNPVIAMEEIERIMRPGGIFILQTTNKYNPLIILSRIIPFGIKKRLFKSLFGDNPSGTFKTIYRLNTPKELKRNRGLLKLQKIFLLEDVFCHNWLLYIFSLLIYRILQILKLNSIKGNIIAVYRKET